MRKTPKPHQLDALAFAKPLKKNGLLMEMRLGKNLVYIRDIEQKGISDSLHLFVTDFGAMQSIEDELISEGHKVTVLTGVRKKRLKLLNEATEKGAGWVISNYESVSRLALHKLPWKSVALDETIKIANPKSTLTKYFCSSAWTAIEYKYIMNGKPNPENIGQLCCQFIFLNGEYMGSKNFYSYRHRYWVMDGDWDWVPKLGHRKEVYDYIRKFAFVLLREDAKIGPEKQYQKRMVPINAAQKKAIKELAKEYEINDVEYKNELGIQIGMSYIAGGLLPSPKGEPQPIISRNKLLEIEKLLNQIDGKVLIWCRFRAEQTMIVEFLAEIGIHSIHINGDTKREVRKTSKEFFARIKKIRCAVLTIASCAKGQDWSMAEAAIYYSNEWSNDKRGQSEDRLVHILKVNPVLIIDLISEGTTDELVCEGLREKEFDSKLIMSNYLSKLKGRK